MEDQILDSTFSQQDSPGTENLTYSTFGSRLAAAILDGLIGIAVAACLFVLNFVNKNLYYVTVPVQIAFLFFYHIYLVQAKGATPGKLAMNLKIVKTDGTSVDFQSAFMRYLPSLIFGVLSQLTTLVSVASVDADVYNDLSWIQQMQHIAAINPMATKVIQYIYYAWIIVDIIVFFSNKEKRAMHDKIADTVVISTR
jgi:uncharacterized RDD family membrane protein YckC